MRREGLAKHDISVYVEERVEYIHSRIALKPLVTGIEHAMKLSYLFESKVNTTLGKILSNRVKKLAEKTETKLANRVLLDWIAGLLNPDCNPIWWIGL